MDLFEYQGRDLFERHGLPVLGGGVAETPQEARAIAERLGGRVVVKAQVKVGGRGKAGGVKLAADADEARGPRDRHPRHGHQGPHRAQGDAGRDRGHHGGVLLLLPAGPGQPHLPLHRQRGRRHGDRDGRRGGPGAGRQDRHRRQPGRGRGQGARDRRRRQVPGRGRRADRRHRGEALAGLRGRGRDAGRGQPAGQGRRRPGAAAGREDHPGRERRFPAPRPRGADRPVRGRPAGAGGQGQEPQLRQARRRGRHHRQRRRPGHVDPRRGRVRGSRSTAASSRPTSSTSAAAPARR